MQLHTESSLSAGVKARLQILRRSMRVPAAGTHGPPPPSPWLEMAKAPCRLGRCWPAQGWRMATRQPRRRMPRGRWAMQQMLQLLEDAPTQPPAAPLWGTLRVCATPGPHGGPWPVLETEGHFVTRLANTVCAVWAWACTNNVYQEVIEKGSFFCQVGKTNHHANENDCIQTLSPTGLLPKIATDTVTHGKCV